MAAVMPTLRSESTSAYARLGLRPVINASATLTALGGSLMPPR
jgi:seryl-tRNA(Sec) selenium transferase